MRISDWSSDVCSSDLAGDLRERVAVIGRHAPAVGGLDRQDLVEWDRGNLEQFLLGITNRRIRADRGHHATDERGHPRPDGLGRTQAHVPKRRIEALVRLVAGKDSDRLALRAIEQRRSEEHTSELQSLMRISYAVFCL